MNSAPRRKRVVFLYTTDGGIGQMVSNLRHSGLLDRFEAEFIATHLAGSTLSRVRVFLLAYARLLRLLVAGRVSVIHAHMSYRGSFWRKAICIVTGRMAGAGAVLHLHGSELKVFIDGSGAWQRRMIRSLFNASESVIVLSHQWEQYVRAFAPEANIVTVHNFVDANAMRSSLDRLAVPRNPHRLLFLGLIGRRKGIYDLVAALPRIIESVPDVHLVAGGGGEIEEVRALAVKLGVAGHLTLPGWVSGDAKMRLLAEASVYVLPSYNEGVPVSILEAMACGLPVVSTPVGGIPDAITDGTEGFLVQPGDVPALADRLSALLLDPALRERMGSQGQQTSAIRFAPEKAVEQISALYVAAGASRSVSGAA